MSTLSVPNSFTPGANADAAQVNANYSAIVTYVNAQCVVKDASLAFTNVPSGPSSDPITANQLTRKQYVDNGDVKPWGVTYTGPASIPASGITLCQTSISDPGYDIDVWGVGSCVVNPAASADLSNIWELAIYLGGPAGANTTQRTGLKIPIVTIQQSLCNPLRVQTFPTGTYGGTLVALMKAFRGGGTQAQLTTAGTTDGRYFYLDLFYKRH